MEPLVATVISIIAPFLIKGADEFAKSAGKEAFDGAKALVNRLSRWWKGDPVANAVVADFASEPDVNAKMLGTRLFHALEKDPTLTADLRALVDNLAADVEVIQRIDIGNGVTGVKIRELVTGHVRVQQEIKDAVDVTGVQIDRMGGRG